MMSLSIKTYTNLEYFNSIFGDSDSFIGFNPKKATVSWTSLDDRSKVITSTFHVSPINLQYFHKNYTYYTDDPSSYYKWERRGIFLKMINGGYDNIPSSYTLPDDFYKYMYCEKCKERPLVWIFNNGSYAKCNCNELRSESIMSYINRNNGSALDYPNLYDIWNEFIESGYIPTLTKEMW